MNIIKVVAISACGLLIVLFTLITSIENPEKKLFEETVESIMINEGLSSYQEVLDASPELKDIKSKMQRVSYLNNCINRIPRGPAPNVSREKSIQIQDYTHEIRQLRRNINEELTQLLAIYVENQP